ncbi:MAG: hypothetical protein DCF19_09815 [Pseudanabaena frigida]|uniref:Uncharacterized protein n=1 Tax=Pseudanabaena frigida TaxID=945775 RepID=A0A2W4YED2_9CYAN|nr:MAG: hypothetical protein DCF19_09815 [Pseudanabaena frigida]
MINFKYPYERILFYCFRAIAASTGILDQTNHRRLFNSVAKQRLQKSLDLVLTQSAVVFMATSI